MSLPVAFHRAASAEFIEASVWYESKRFGLVIEFMAEIDLVIRDGGTSVPKYSLTYASSTITG